MERTRTTEGERGIKMNERIRHTLYKNRYLLPTISFLLLGTILGVIALQNLPMALSEKIGSIVIMEKTDFQKIWCDRFFFSEFLLIGFFLSGFCLVGHGMGSLFLLLYGMIYGIKTAANYRFFASGYLVPALIEFFSFLIFSVFCLLTMCENSFYSAEILYKIIYKKDEKLRYNAKNQSIKLLFYTIIIAVFSALSSYLFLILG